MESLGPSMFLLIPIGIIVIAFALAVLPYMYGARFAQLKKIKDQTQMGFSEAFADLFMAGLAGGILGKFNSILGMIVPLALLYYFLKKRYNPDGKQYAIVFGIMIGTGFVLNFLVSFATISFLGGF